MPVNTKKNLALIVPHTHWDREWRYPIWKNRALLTRFMQELLELLDADPDYRCFVADGQCILIEDYLDLHPGDEARIRRHVTDGRLKIGPWYTLPDLYPIDGECLVRNLLKGIRFCARFGGHLEVGYNTFGWGQTAQFPQIYAGFGIDFVIAAKRVSKLRAPHSEYLWEAPDGSRLLASRLGDDARANGFFQFYTPVRFGLEYQSEDFRFTWGRTGQVLHRADPKESHQDYFRIDTETGYHPDRVKQSLLNAWHAMDETLAPDARLIMNGSDFSTAQPILTRMVREADAACEDIQIRMGTLEEYAELLRERLKDTDIPVVKGELRDGPACATSANALAVRMPIKQLNKRVENALLRVAEPLAAMLTTLGEAYPAAWFEKAWTYLLHAHPHDSINGVTQDKTVEDNLHRLRQAEELAEVLIDESIERLVKRLDPSPWTPDDVLVLVYNPLPFPVSTVVHTTVDVPREANAWEVGLIDADGERRDVQFLSRREHTTPVHDLASRPWPFYHDRHELVVDPGEIPAMGYRTFAVRIEKTFDRRGEWWPEMRTEQAPPLADAHAGLENDFLRVTLNTDGTFDLEDKTTGHTYPGIHALEDAGDVGDYWAYYPPYQNQVHVSCGATARTWIEENGPLSATVAVERRLEIPARAHRAERGTQGEDRRDDETRALVVTSRLTLTHDARGLEIDTTVINTAEDHRLRVLLPTGLQTDHAHSAGHFYVDRRPIRPVADADAMGGTWPEMRTQPMQQFVDVSDGSHGLAVVSDSLTEYEMMEDASRTLALTLFRAVRNRICTEFRSSGKFPRQHGGQLLQTMTFRYALVPHAGDWQEGGVAREAQRFNAPPRTYQFSTTTPGGALPPQHGFLQLEPKDLVLSACKRAEERDSVVVRLYNPTNASVEGILRLATPIREVHRLDLNETRKETLPLTDGRQVHFRVGHHEICTLELVQ